MNRREMLTGMAVAGAAVAMSAPAIARGLPTSRSAWDKAFANWSAVQGKYDALCDRFDTAEEAYGDASGPRPGRYFDDYNLNMSMERGHVEGALAIYNTRQRITGGVQIDVKQVADEFEAYRRRNTDLRKHFCVDEHWEQAKAYQPTYYEARDRIMMVAAPDVAALLVKIEIAAVSLDDEHAEAMLADARRLLPQGRA